MKEILNYILLLFGDFNFKLATIFTFALLIVTVFILLFVIKKTIYKATHIGLSKKYSIYSLIKYFIIIFSFIISLQIFGFNLSVLIAGSAALLVGLGLGLQNLFSDFISGIIILIDSTVKVNDIIEVNGIVCQVQEIDIRTTTVLTRDDKYIILPNSDLTKNQLINWTHSKITSRFEISVGVDYSSDVKLVMTILKEATDKQEGVLQTPSPFVRFSEFGDSSLNFSVIFWSDEVFRVENIKSEIRIRIFEMFNSNHITIPFPQRVIHLYKE